MKLGFWLERFDGLKLRYAVSGAGHATIYYGKREEKPLFAFQYVDKRKEALKKL